MESSSAADSKTLLYFGALLHDIGKIVYRGSSQKGTHSKLGADFIANEVGARNESLAGTQGRLIIEQIRYHHAKELKAASLSDDSLAFVTYFADNISAGMDRKNEGDEEQAASFDRTVKLRKIFNILNGHHDDNTIEHEDYNAVRERIKNRLVETSVSQSNLNSLLNLLEATASTIPSSTNRTELIDVSLYDHAKTTAGIAACIYEYLRSHGIENYREVLFDQRLSARYYEEPMFLLYSCDMSGIQDFIYNISGAGALRQLRARSQYLELLLEHIVDELLQRLELCRANLLYTGGGHAYLLLPNTPEVKRRLGGFESEVREWFVDNYRTDLFVASAWVECSANDLANRGENKQRYPMLYRQLSRKLSAAKASRYSAETIRKLNFRSEEDAGHLQDHSRECTECHRSDLNINDEGKCTLCAVLGDVSRDLVNKDVFVVMPACQPNCPAKDTPGLAVPFGYELVMYTRKAYLAKRPKVHRVYTKNTWDMGENLATHIWMGDYAADTCGVGISAYADKGASLEDDLGIKRLGVLRADVDNLGSVFVSGLPAEKVSISRTSTLSRALSFFFKHQINEILQKRQYQVQIIYSGGDDLFLIGNWNDVILAGVDIRQALDEYTGNGSLTISAGIGMFDAKYPIARMAAETGDLEDRAKAHLDKTINKTKDALALWSEQTVFSWDDFIHEVIPRMERVRKIFKDNEKGKAFIYQLIELLRGFDEAVSESRQKPLTIHEKSLDGRIRRQEFDKAVWAPRLAYLLARSFEGVPDGTQISLEFYDWACKDRERRILIAALEWYVYGTREGR